MRTKQDKCVLCQISQADQRNSHIVPKFMAKSYMNQGQSLLYTFESDNLASMPAPRQDLVKEDYLLCSECEKYFGVLDRYFSEHVHKPLVTNPRSSAYIQWDVHMDSGKILEALEANSSMAQLFIQSLIFRTCISTKSPFNEINFNSSELSSLREHLCTYRAVRERDVKENLMIERYGKLFLISPYALFVRMDRLNTPFSSLFSVEVSEEFVGIHAGEYFIQLYDHRKPFYDSQSFIINSALLPVKVVFLPNAFFHYFFKQAIHKLFGQNINLGQMI